MSSVYSPSRLIGLGVSVLDMLGLPYMPIGQQPSIYVLWTVAKLILHLISASVGALLSVQLPYNVPQITIVVEELLDAIKFPERAAAVLAAIYKDTQPISQWSPLDPATGMVRSFDDIDLLQPRPHHTLVPVIDLDASVIKTEAQPDDSNPGPSTAGSSLHMDPIDGPWKPLPPAHETDAKTSQQLLELGWLGGNSKCMAIAVARPLARDHGPFMMGIADGDQNGKFLFKWSAYDTDKEIINYRGVRKSKAKFKDIAASGGRLLGSLDGCTERQVLAHLRVQLPSGG